MRERLLCVKVDQGHANEAWITAKRESGEKIYVKLVDHYPHFFTEPKDVTHPSIVSIEPGHRSIDGYELQKITVERPGNVSELRDVFLRPHEGDIPYTQRTIIDEECLGWCDVDLAHVRNNEYVTKSGLIDHVSSDVDAELLDVAYYDIEVASSPYEFPDPGEARHPVISVTVYDKAEDEWLIWSYHPTDKVKLESVDLNSCGTVPVTHKHFSNERSMLSSFGRWLRERSPDLLCGWYSGGGGAYKNSGFDWPYLSNRLRRLGMRYDTFGSRGIVSGDPCNCPGVLMCDLLDVHRAMAYGTLKNNKLVTVAEEYAGVELEKEPGNIMEWWKEDLASLLDYNAKDVEATWLVDEKREYSAFALRLYFTTFVDNMGDVHKASIAHDVNLLRRVKGRFAAPMKPPKHERGGKRYKGAKVLKPEPGLHEWVGVFDLKSLYPTCIVAANLSYETYTEDGGGDDVWISPQGHAFRQNVRGIIPEITQEFMDLSDEYRGVDDKGYWATKIMRNAIYGICGYPGFRFYREQVAETVTELGREVIQSMVDKSRELGYLPVYGDTDSTAVLLKTDDPIEEGSWLEETLTRAACERARELDVPHPDIFEVQFEKVYRRLLVAPVKKRYAGYTVIEDGEWLDTPKMSTTGFESKRADTPAISVDLQNEVFRQLLQEGVAVEEVTGAVNQAFVSVLDGREEIQRVAPTPRLAQRIEEYESQHYAMKAAKYSNEWLGKRLSKGDRFYVMYVKKVPPAYSLTNCIALEDDDEVPAGFEVDWERHADVAVKKKLKTIMDALGMRERLEAIGTRSLDDFLD